MTTAKRYLTALSLSTIFFILLGACVSLGYLFIYKSSDSPQRRVLNLDDFHIRKAPPSIPSDSHESTVKPHTSPSDKPPKNIIAPPAPIRKIPKKTQPVVQNRSPSTLSKLQQITKKPSEQTARKPSASSKELTQSKPQHRSKIRSKPKPKTKPKPKPKKHSETKRKSRSKPLSKRRIKHTAKSKSKKKLRTSTTSESLNTKKSSPSLATTPQHSKRIDKARFLSVLRARIERNKRYPRPAKRRRLQGKVQVSFTVTRTGQVRNIKLKGSRIFFNSAKEAVIKAFPLSTKNTNVSFPLQVTLTMRYKLR